MKCQGHAIAKPRERERERQRDRDRERERERVIKLYMYRSGVSHQTILFDLLFSFCRDFTEMYLLCIKDIALIYRKYRMGNNPPPLLPFTRLQSLKQRRIQDRRTGRAIPRLDFFGVYFIFLFC